MPTRARFLCLNKTARAHLPHVGWRHGLCGRGVDENNNIHPKAPFLDLEMMDEGGGNARGIMVGGADVWQNARDKSVLVK